MVEMDKHIVRWVLAGMLSFALPSLRSLAQSPASSQALPAKWDSLRGEFTRYQEQAFQEKVFVHVDKSFYLAGEVLWFKVYDVDGYFHRPMPAEGIAYVELIGREQKPVLRATVRLKEGTGN